MMCTRVRALTLLLFVALCFQKLPAQVNSSGSIAGQVADSSGAVITKATVIAVQTQTNQEWKALSDSLGNYIFPNLPKKRASASSRSTALPSTRATA